MQVNFFTVHQSRRRCHRRVRPRVWQIKYSIIDFDRVVVHFPTSSLQRRVINSDMARQSESPSSRNDKLASVKNVISEVWPRLMNGSPNFPTGFACDSMTAISRSNYDAAAPEAGTRIPNELRLLS